MRGARLVLVAALLGASPCPGVADEVAMRAAVHEGYARIAFDWPAPVAFDAQADGLTLTLHFKRPLEAPVERLARQLPSYIVAARLDEGGTALVAHLAHPVTVKTFTLHEKTVIVDLQPAAATVEPPAAPKPVTAPAVRVAATATDGGTRLSFEWPRRVEFVFAAKGSKALLTFRAAGDIDEATLAALLPDFAPKVEAQGRATVVAFALPAGASLKALRSGNAVILDAHTPKPKPAAQPAPAAAASDTAAAPEPAAAAASAPPDAPPPRPPAKVAVHVVPADSGAGLRFDWPVPTGAAVFRRGGAVWIVFSTPTTLDLADLSTHGAQLFASVEPMALDHATALRLVLRDPLQPGVHRAGTAWVVDLRPQAAPLDAPIAIEPHSGASPASVKFRVHGAAAPVRLADPEIGRLLVVPVDEIGRGIDKAAEFVDFRVLPSTQGLVLEPLSDGVVPEPGGDGVVVTRPGGLTLSSDRDRLLGHRPAAAGTLFDFAAWRGDKNADYVDERARLEAAIAAAPAAQRTEPRLALARFYFAHLFAAETVAVIEAIGRDDPSRLSQPPVLALEGAACLLVDDVKCAGDALGQRALDGRSEVALWRGSLATRVGDEEGAAEDFLDGVAMLPTYPLALRSRFALEAARAMLATKRESLAGPLLDLVLNDRVSSADRAMALYLDGRRLQQTGHLEEALARWDQAAKTDEPQARAEALVARATALLDAGRMSRADAIQALDRERFAWRGGPFEFKLLRKLGELELAEGDEGSALNLLHEAASYFPDEPEAKAVGKETSDAFADLFLGDKGNDLPPLKALALYDAFHDLEPPGDRYDAIVKRLIDRLVSVDLLDRAADLLDDQVTKHLAALDKARGATQLALLRLMNHQPDLALAALDIAVGQDLPSDLARQRQQLRARVLMELGRPADALNLIASDESRDADRLRADIYWHGHDWKNAAQTLSRLAGSPPPAGGKIDADEGRVVVGLAAALTLADDHAGLAKLRAAFGPPMEESSYAAAFRVLAGDVGSSAGGDAEAIAVQVAQVGALQDFMAMYKPKLAAADQTTAIR